MAVNGTAAKLPSSGAGATASSTPAARKPAGPAPSTAPPPPPINTKVTPNASATATKQPTTAAANSKSKRAKADPTPPDPTALYENVKSRIAALEEDVRQLEEEERRAADEARENIKGISDSVIQSKYIELFQEMKRIERDFGKEKQKLVKEKDASKSQLTKANLAKTKFEGIAREMQKDNKKLRDDNKRLMTSIEDAQHEIMAMKEEIERRQAYAKKKERKALDSPEIVVKVVCKYREELYFKMSRKSKMSLLFKAWTERMDTLQQKNGAALPNGDTQQGPRMQFVFCHLGRTLEHDQTPEDLQMEGGDEILAVEMMDLTVDTAEPYVPPAQRERLEKHWSTDPVEAKSAIEDIFNGVVRERLKHVLRQYELREKHFECVMRSKELEILVTRARADEQKQMANEELHRMTDLLQEGQDFFMQKLAESCSLVDPPMGERTQHLLDLVRPALENRYGRMPPEAQEGDIANDR